MMHFAYIREQGRKHILLDSVKAQQETNIVKVFKVNGDSCKMDQFKALKNSNTDCNVPR